VLVGDEGGYGPRLKGNAAALDVVTRSIERAGLQPGAQVALAVDAASTHFHSAGRYRLQDQPGAELDAEALGEVWQAWAGRYPLLSLEDGCAEDDWEGWSHLTTRLGRRLQLVGDDLFVTNAARVSAGVERGVANSVLIKLNQIGTLAETLQALRLTLAAGYRPVVSARSGETEDDLLADLAVATGAGQIKIGSIVRSERLAKYNQLLRLEEQLGAGAGWLGGRLFDSFTP
jgi:enolase